MLLAFAPATVSRYHSASMPRAVTDKLCVTDKAWQVQKEIKTKIYFLSGGKRL